LVRTSNTADSSLLLPHNKSLDASGGSVFLNLFGAAEGVLISRRRVNSTVMRLHTMTKTLCLCGVTILLLACARQKPASHFIVLERSSPAVANNGVLIQNVGLETLGGVVTPLLKTGCATPCRDVEIFSTAQDNQRKFQVTLYR